MIDRQGLKVLIECDSCSDIFSGHEHEHFSSVWNRAKEEGWQTKTISEPRKPAVWIHCCPSCGVD